MAQGAPGHMGVPQGWGSLKRGGLLRVGLPQGGAPSSVESPFLRPSPLPPFCVAAHLYPLSHTV